jgi:DNA mismatch repair ATPase MutS
MKAFLMYRDRDFDPEQLIVRKEKAARHSRRGEDAPDLKCILPWNEEALRQDLGLDIVFNAMARGDRFIWDVASVAMLQSLTDIDTICYRQNAFIDCQRNAQIVGEMYRIAIEAIEGERKNYWSFFARYPSGILSHAVEVLQVFVGMLKRLRRMADQHAGEFQSDAFSQLLSMLREELSNEYFAEIERHLARLKFRSGVLVSAHLGKANKGTDYVLRKPKEDHRSWLTRLFSDNGSSYSFQLPPRDEAGHRALSELGDRGLNLVANALAQSTDHILSFFQMLRTELAFYIGCLNLREHLGKIEEPVCLPIPVPAGERKLSFSDLHDVSLALTVGRKIVGNDLSANGKNIVIITGANTGGKSTFLRSVGLAHVMMQAGIFVSAKAFSAETSDGVFTHYRREEDATMESGKWDEELGRMSAIADRVRSNSLILFNESFASTNEREGSEIAAQIVDALLDAKVKVFFVTHLYHFASVVFARRARNAIFLRAERRADGSRPFRLVEAEPLQTSHGVDLYRTIFGDTEEVRRAESERDAARPRADWSS